MSDLHHIEFCTKCNKKLTKLKFFVNLNLKSFQEKESNSWENIPPLDMISNEVLCEECFNTFLDNLGKNNVSKC